ncbi:MAG: hypothetical protein ACFFAS_08020 [Promethearchaeota archaeon]
MEENSNSNVDGYLCVDIKKNIKTEDNFITEKFNAEEEIIGYLKSKGEIKACLLHKLFNHFCSARSKHHIDRKKLIASLISMLKNRTIEIILPKPFDVIWKAKKLANLTYLNDGIYYIRSNQDWCEEKNPFYPYWFDSRKINFKSQDTVKENIEWLLIKLIEYPNLKYKLIIHYPRESRKINIYEELEETFHQRILESQVFLQVPIKGRKLQIPVKTQEINLSIIQSFRNKYMCFYITLIESIQHAIVQYQKSGKKDKKFKKNIAEFTKKFGYYCLLYTRSDWMDIKPNPHRWESYFKTFKIPIKILNIEFEKMRFQGKTFEFYLNFRYCVFVEEKFDNIIKTLKRIGYKKVKELSKKKQIAIGFSLDVHLLCPAIEYFYFLGKYIAFFHLFLLFNHTFDHFKEINSEIKFTAKDKNLFKIFYPIMNSLFGASYDSLTHSLKFKFNTLNPDELESLYNHFLLSRIKEIESKLSRYFLLKYFRFKNKRNPYF